MAAVLHPQRPGILQTCAKKKKKKVNLGSPSETVQFDDMVCISLTPLPLKLHKGCMIKRLARESVFTKKIGEI